MGWRKLFTRMVTLPFTTAEAIMTIGGQAVVEGVMMKSPRHLATAVRKPNGTIKVKHRKEQFLTQRTFLGKVPFVRGMIVLFETMIKGMRELNWSANEAIDEEEEKLNAWELGLMMALSIALALALFKFLPLLLASWITKDVGNNWTFNLLDGGIKFSFFLLYLLAISRMKDVKRLFQYHGAEHKSVNCYEARRALTPRNAKKFTKRQARCGTTFVVYVIVLSILVYLFIPFGATFWEKYVLRIALLPVIAGIAYEWTRFAGKYYCKSAFLRFISAPGMAVQALTTREPDLKQLEVAIAALKRVLKEERVLKE